VRVSGERVVDPHRVLATGRYQLDVGKKFRVVLVVVGALSLLWGAFSCKQPGSTPTVNSEATPLAQAAAVPEKVEELAPTAERATLEPLKARLGELALKAGGKVGIALMHVESGRSVTVGGEQWLPLQSVFKLPLAVAVLQDVKGGQVSPEQMLTVSAEDRAPGVASNEKKWTQVPRTVSVRQLLEYSLVDSDNTASDKLLDLIGGPAALTGRMQSLGFQGIAVRAPTKAMGPSGELPNDATAEALARLLAALARGEILESSQRALLWEVMARARTGERRIRAGLPPGTHVLDKTGTGANGSVTNDVGLVTLPGNAGHLAIAVFIAGSSLPSRAQEDLIAEIARTSFHSFVL
jgi:beta-lactamase class A